MQFLRRVTSLVASIALLGASLTGCAFEKDYTKEFRRHIKAGCDALSASSESFKNQQDIQRVSSDAINALDGWFGSGGRLEILAKPSYQALDNDYWSISGAATRITNAESIPNSTALDYSSLETVCSKYSVEIKDFVAKGKELLPTGLVDMSKKLAYLLKNPHLVIDTLIKTKCMPTSSSAFYYRIEDMGGSFAGDFMVIYDGVVIDNVQVTDTQVMSYVPGSLTEPFYFGVGPGGVGDEPWGCSTAGVKMTLEELLTATGK